MKKKEQMVSNTKIAIVFFVFLAFIVGVSLILKAITIIRASRFDGSNRFTLSISNGRNVEVMSLSPSSKNIVVFKLNNSIKSEEVGRFLGIPIDGFIISHSLDLNHKTNSLFINAIFNHNNLKTNLTVVDLLRIAILTRTISESSIEVRIVKDTNILALDKLVDRFVRESFIEKDHQTIQIINATGIGGLGNRLARLITNMGGNVIIVATENNLRRKSEILYIEKKTYTIERLQQVLGYEAVKKKSNTISDITIIIGEDGVNSSPF